MNANLKKWLDDNIINGAFDSYENERWVVTYATTIQGRPVAFGVAFNGKTFSSRKEAWEHCKFAHELQLKKYDTNSCLIEEVRVSDEETRTEFQVQDELLCCCERFGIQQLLNH